MFFVQNRGIDPLRGADHRRSSASRYRASYVYSLVDRTLTAMLLVLASPIILAAMTLVRATSKGPVIYAQKRLGKGGRCFTIYKIRSMYVESEPNGPRWCIPGDRRVTPVGRFLRATHIDELPQLLNILWGDMSLIGPRPERPEIVAELEKAIPDYPRRLEVLPGLTGLAQVLQSPDTDLDSVRTKLFYDLHYIENAGWWLDARILAATLLHVLSVPRPMIAGLLGLRQDPGTGDQSSPALHEILEANSVS